MFLARQSNRLGEGVLAMPSRNYSVSPERTTVVVLQPEIPSKSPPASSENLIITNVDSRIRGIRMVRQYQVLICLNECLRRSKRHSSYWHDRANVTGEWTKVTVTPNMIRVVKLKFLTEPSQSQASEVLKATWLGRACYYVVMPSGLRVWFDPRFTFIDKYVQRCHNRVLVGYKG